MRRINLQVKILIKKHIYMGIIWLNETRKLFDEMLIEW